jgi:TIM-barrel protein
MAVIDNASVLAAMAGITNGKFARKCLNYGEAGLVTIGGYPIGKEMIIASLESVKRGRTEFIIQRGEEAQEISREAMLIPELSSLIINIRVNSVEDTERFVQEISNILTEKPIIEINAHCRQEEFIKRGGGQSLLKRINILTKILNTISAKDFRIALKIRGNNINPKILIPKIDQWQLEFIHIDSYKEGIMGTDLDLLGIYFKHINTSIIGNNSVIDKRSAQAILDAGAKRFSVARAAKKNPFIFRELVKSI